MWYWAGRDLLLLMLLLFSTTFRLHPTRLCCCTHFFHLSIINVTHMSLIGEGSVTSKLRYTNATQYSTVMFHSTESLWLPTAATVLTPIMMVATAANGRSIKQVATTDTNTSIVLSYLYSSPSTSFCWPLFLPSFERSDYYLNTLDDFCWW